MRSTDPPQDSLVPLEFCGPCARGQHRSCDRIDCPCWFRACYDRLLRRRPRPGAPQAGPVDGSPRH